MASNKSINFSRPLFSSLTLLLSDIGIPYACEFYLDAKEKKYIDECGAANFFGIKDNTYTVSYTHQMCIRDSILYFISHSIGIVFLIMFR